MFATDDQGVAQLLARNAQMDSPDALTAMTALGPAAQGQLHPPSAPAPVVPILDPQQQVQQPGGFTRFIKGMLAGAADAALKESTGMNSVERQLAQQETANLASQTDLRNYQLAQARDANTHLILPPAVADALQLPQNTPITKGQLHDLIDKYAAGEGRYVPPKPKSPEEQAFEYFTTGKKMDPASAYAAMLALKNPDKPETDKQKFATLAGKLSTSPKFNAALTDSKQFANLIAASPNLSAEEKAFGLGYLATNNTPAASATNVNLRIAPQWARVQQGQTALDLRIAKETGRLPSNDIIQRGQFAAELLPHIPTIRAELEEADKRGLLGPLIGRGTEFMAGKIGSTGNADTDRFYSKLRSDLHLLSSGLNRAHFGGRAGIETLKYFDNLVGGSFRSKDSIFGTLDTANDYLNTYASATPGFGQGVDAGGISVLPEMPTVSKTQGGAPRGGSFIIEMNGKRYQYKGSGDTADTTNYMELKQ